MSKERDPNNQHRHSSIKLLEKLARRFWRLNISQKMHLGFFPLVVLILLISIFSLTKLNQLNQLNTTILQVHIPARATLGKMGGTLLDQESFIRRYSIFKDEELLKVYHDHSREFIDDIARLKTLPVELNLPLRALDKSYGHYSTALLNGIKLLKEDPRYNQEFEQQIHLSQDEVIASLAEIGRIIEADQNAKSEVTATIGTLAFNGGLVFCVVGILLATSAAAIVTHNIVGAVRKLQLATEMIAQGNFDYHPAIRNKDELGDLAEAFSMMATRLKKLEEMYLDASPLTRLPGGIAIENILKKKIEQHKLFAFCLMDIDNFKSYNDHYGYAKGNEVIKNTAAIIEKAVAAHGDSDDFVGHIGGDDFVVITSPDRCLLIGEMIIARFDAETPRFYTQEDRQRGFIFGKNRQGQKVRFPLASLSVAVVSNQTHQLENHIMVGEIAAEIKKRAKAISGSAIIIDRRQYSPDGEEKRKVVYLPGRKTA